MSMQFKLGLIGALAVIVIGLGINLYISGSGESTATPIATFEDCVAAGYPVMESYPRQCATEDGQTFTEVIAEAVPAQVAPSLTEADARAIALASTVCTDEGAIGAFETYNPNSGTWWFTLQATQQGCSPACVVYEEGGRAEVNWRCTGLLPQ